MSVTRVPIRDSIIFRYHSDTDLRFSRLRTDAVDAQALMLAEAINSLRPTAFDFFRDRVFELRGDD